MPGHFVGSRHKLVQFLDGKIRLGICEKGKQKIQFLAKDKARPILDATAKLIIQAEVDRLKQEGKFKGNTEDPIVKLENVLQASTFEFLKVEFQRRYSSYRRIIEKR